MGLVFVAASLAARLVNADTATVGAQAFVTPIIIHFSAVLVVAMLFMIPTPSTLPSRTPSSFAVGTIPTPPLSRTSSPSCC